MLNWLVMVVVVSLFLFIILVVISQLLGITVHPLSLSPENYMEAVRFLRKKSVSFAIAGVTYSSLS